MTGPVTIGDFKREANLLEMLPGLRSSSLRGPRRRGAVGRSAGAGDPRQARARAAGAINQPTWHPIYAGRTRTGRAVASDGFRLMADQRKRIAKQIKELQPDASQRKIAKVLGVDDRTIRRDLGEPAANAAPTAQEPSETAASEPAAAANAAPTPSLGGDEAAKLVTKAIEKAEKKAVAAAAKAASKAAIPADLPKASDRFRIFQADIREADIAPESVDCILTDPPYPIEHLDCFSWLAAAALKWLKPGGTLAVMSGQTWLPEVMARLCGTDGLEYRWMLSHLTPGGQAVQIFPRKVNTFWKPVNSAHQGRGQSRLPARHRQADRGRRVRTRRLHRRRHPGRYHGGLRCRCR